MFDTHCHLNFSRFKTNVNQVIADARKQGVGDFVVPGTDIETSRKAVELAALHEGVYAAVGIHPHHAASFAVLQDEEEALKGIEELIRQPNVVAVGEVGIDRHVYERTKYHDYIIREEFVSKQKRLLRAQISLAVKHGKSMILHNWEAAEDLLGILGDVWEKSMERHVVFHCCEPDRGLLRFALDRGIFIGVDGDVTYDRKKADFIKSVPLPSLVLETDSPYLLPEPLRSRKLFPNTPSSIPLIADFVAVLLSRSPGEVRKTTADNARELFALPLTRKEGSL